MTLLLKNAATGAIVLSIWIVRTYILRSQHFFNVTLATIALVKKLYGIQNMLPVQLTNQITEN